MLLLKINLSLLEIQERKLVVRIRIKIQTVNIVSSNKTANFLCQSQKSVTDLFTATATNISYLTILS